MHRFCKQKSGFTLLEVLVSLFMLSVLLAGVFSVILYNLRVAKFASNSFIAGGLAQEGLEVVRNIRDNDWIAGNAFGTSLSVGSDWRVAWDSFALLPSDSSAQLSKDNVTGIYSYDASDPATIFRRTISIEEISIDEYKIMVKVLWKDGLVSTSISAEEHLFNWN